MNFQMKIISKETLKSDSSCGSNRVPSKEDSFWQQQSKISCTVPKIPENDACSTENTDNPCKASRYVKCIMKIHKKVEFKTIYCKFCNKGRKIKEIDRQRIFNKTKVPRFQTKRLCILNADNKCPRVKQVRDWLIYCKFKRFSISKCSMHSGLFKKLKEDFEMRNSVISEIMSN